MTDNQNGDRIPESEQFVEPVRIIALPLDDVSVNRQLIDLIARYIVRRILDERKIDQDDTVHLSGV